ncbi:MAG: hypothetical protein J1E00_03000 [Oscillospiraceae bacterium]|nr:hypothetical protein [Oscillospiraceae bacterium]
MKTANNARYTKRPAGGVLYWAVSVLLVLTLFTTWMACGLFAKYLSTNDELDSARVAATGVKTFELLEHKVKNVSETDPTAVYEFVKDEFTSKGNTYDTVPPGYDLPKDPFVRLELVDAEVDYRLYVRVTKSEDFPDTIDVKLRDCWQPVPGQKDVYVYDGYFDAGQNYDCTGDKVIYILDNNLLYVSQYYAGETFDLSFEAWLAQVD